jgi:2-C-methyl-D-erythritol 2,4-cyclodiphosphate synthase
MDFRIGHGFDVHQLQEGETLTLGGVNIPHKQGLKGYSDADVVIHAVCDACLGALNLGDIGWQFPPGDPQYKQIDSAKLLTATQRMLAEQGYSLNNLDVTVCLQAPKLQSHIATMRMVMADCLQADPSRVSVKATTTEQLGPEGREEGITAYAVVLLTSE